MPDGGKVENCAYMYGSSYPNPSVFGLWNDKACNERYSYVCGWAPGHAEVIVTHLMWYVMNELVVSGACAKRSDD
jgi:hypothetical protein